MKIGNYYLCVGNILYVLDTVADLVRDLESVGFVLFYKLTAVHGIQSAFDEAMSYCRYHPSKGYWWHFKDHEEQGKQRAQALPKQFGSEDEA